MGVVYMMKSRGPSTEPWGTPHKQDAEQKSLILSLELFLHFP